MSLNQLLLNLSSQGCYPGIYLRSKTRWRAHVNCAGNYWAEAKTPLRALRAAEKKWVEAGRPMDGMADGPAEGEERGR